MKTTSLGTPQSCCRVDPLAPRVRSPHSAALRPCRRAAAGVIRSVPHCPVSICLSLLGDASWILRTLSPPLRRALSGLCAPRLGSLRKLQISPGLHENTNTSQRFSLVAFSPTPHLHLSFPFSIHSFQLLSPSSITTSSINFEGLWEPAYRSFLRRHV